MTSSLLKARDGFDAHLIMWQEEILQKKKKMINKYLNENDRMLGIVHCKIKGKFALFTILNCFFSFKIPTFLAVEVKFLECEELP